MNFPSLMTWCLMGLNAAVFLASVLAGNDPMTGSPAVMLQWGANHAPLTLNGEYWRLFTSMFLHWGVLHLSMNMLALWSGGRIVEAWYGRWRYVLLYLFSGLAGGLASTWWHADALGAGASGAVFGVFGAIFVVAMLAGKRNPQFQALRHNLWMFIVYNAVFGFAIPQIDMAAHVAGFLAGGVLALALRPAWHWTKVLAALAFLGLAMGLILFALQSTQRVTRSSLVERAVFQERLQTFDKKAEALDKRLGQWVSALRSDKMSEDEFRERLQQELLPVWKQQRTALAPETQIQALAPDPYLAALRATVLDYIDARVALLEAIANKVEISETEMQQSRMRAQAAAQRLRQLQATPPRPEQR
jgi:rhomboid protease GluP